jgi:tetratricopeptide (TPR) repeat protein
MHRLIGFILANVVALGWPLWGGSCPSGSAAASSVTIDYPSDGSLFPPDITSPTFVWRDAAAGARIWKIEIVFGGRGGPLRAESAGARPQVGEIDASFAGFVPPTLTSQQQAGHTWKPDAAMWEEIKRRSAGSLATATIAGYGGAGAQAPLSCGTVTLSTSADPVGAPIFFRDVPLIPPQLERSERSAIKPLPDAALPTIKWRLRYITEPQSRTVMTGVPTCINCHSFSRDGATIGLDVDGPLNDKGLYGLAPLRKVTSISNDNVIRWSAYSQTGSPKRFGFMSQVSPDGRFVVTSVEAKGWKGQRLERLYYGAYADYGFGQVFYPTTGVLAWYSKETGKLQPLPGADDPEFVHTSAFWSPDGAYLVFSRARARSAYAPDQKPATYANDPNETQVQYDLYRIPFNNGAGGKAEPIAGASGNGMSNNFPKVSPDGKWLVFVQNKSGLLMRPDSRLYIVPATGGEARPLRSNLAVMNSWHSFSPNGRWLVFSSKTPTLYTRLYLTHIDENGNSTPAILIDNTTAANRAANIPEFVNVGPDGLERMEAPATESYRLFNLAMTQHEKKRFGEEVETWRGVLKLTPDDSRAHGNLGIALAALGKDDEAMAEYTRSLEIDPSSSTVRSSLGSALAQLGRIPEAVEQLQKAVETNPDDAGAQANLGVALAQVGRMLDALEHSRRSVELNPEVAGAQSNLASVLAQAGDIGGAEEHARRAVTLEPAAWRYRFNLVRILAAQRKYAEALPQLEEVVRLDGGSDPTLLGMLAALYGENQRFPDAAAAARKALDRVKGQGAGQLEEQLRSDIARYEAAAKGR